MNQGNVFTSQSNGESTDLYRQDENGDFVPVGRYDPEFTHRMPYGHHVSVVKAGSVTTSYRINPDMITLRAAGLLAKDELCVLVLDEIRNNKQTTVYELVDKILELIYNKAQATLTNPNIKMAADNLEMMIALTSEKEEEKV